MARLSRTQREKRPSIRHHSRYKSYSHLISRGGGLMAVRWQAVFQDQRTCTDTHAHMHTCACTTPTCAPLYGSYIQTGYFFENTPICSAPWQWQCPMYIRRLRQDVQGLLPCQIKGKPPHATMGPLERALVHRGLRLIICELLSIAHRLPRVEGRTATDLPTQAVPQTLPEAWNTAS